MKTFTFAVGMAAGYVLGARAGRDTYDQIVQSAKNLSERPTVTQAQAKLKNAVGGAKDAAASKLKHESSGNGSAAKAEDTGFDSEFDRITAFDRTDDM